MGLCCGKSSVPVVEVKRPINSSQNSGKLPEAPQVSLSKKEKTSQLFGHVSKKKTVDDEIAAGQTTTPKKFKEPFWIFGKKRNQVHPHKIDIAPKKPLHQEKKNQVHPHKIDIAPKKPLHQEKKNQVHPHKIDIAPKKPLHQEKRNQVHPHKIDIAPKKPLHQEKRNQVHPHKIDIAPKKALHQEKRNQVHPHKIDIAPKKPLHQEKKNQVQPIDKTITSKKPCLATPHQDVAMKMKSSIKEEKKPAEGNHIIQAIKIRIEEAMMTKFLRHEQFKCLGLPNPAQFCYINSCLQSLLTLEDFVSTISCQEQVWGSIPEAALLRSFMGVKKAYTSPDFKKKIPLVSAFKGAVSVRALEFKDFNQKDAHEFLTSIFQQIVDLAPHLHMKAASMHKSYKCPVESQMMFKMTNTRVCRGCAAGSNIEEVFTNLSLDLIPGCRTIDGLLLSYLKETDLEFRCKCGSILSGRRSSFATLPRVLVLHLKRFRYTPFYTLQKVCDPIHLNRDLVVSTNQDGYCYSLVCMINHIGNKVGRGHYICDGVDPELNVEDPTDRWFTYDDARVTKTSGASVCNRRQRSAYIMFYKRQD